MDLTMSILVLENAFRSRLISISELERATLLLKSEGRIDRLVKVNRELRGINENHLSTIIKFRSIKKLMKEHIKEEKEEEKNDNMG